MVSRRYDGVRVLTSIDRKCLQDAMSSWNARLVNVALKRMRQNVQQRAHKHASDGRFTRLILKHSKKLLPLQRDLRGETPLEICAMHGDHDSVSAMLQFVKVALF
jgi:hypothetical protein